MDVKNQLSELRAKAGLSQAELGEKLGVSRQTIISIEKEKYDPALPLAFRIADYFCMSIEDIFKP